MEFSGITNEFVLTPATAVQEAQLVHGPLTNNYVTSLALVDITDPTEGDGLQLQAQVQMSEPGTPTLAWESSNPAVATVSQGGFLQALLPGSVAITVLAGTESARLDLVVLPRPIGLAFVNQPGTVEVGETLDPAPTVEVVDARGDRVTSYAGPVTLELQDRAAAVVAAAAAAAPGEVGAPQAADLDGTTTIDAVGGLATFEGLAIPEAGRFRLLATAHGLNPVTSADFEVSLLTADLVVSKVVDKPTALEGEQVTFTVTVVNNGPATATAVKVNDPEPYGMYFDYSPSQGSIDPVGAWDPGNLAPGESATLTIVATIDQATGGQTLENVATAVQLTDQSDDPSNNQASASVDVGLPFADIAVTMEADKVEARENEEVVFTISVLNHGADRADQIVVTDHLPVGLQLVSADAGFDANTGVWTIASLEAGSLTRLSITAVVVKGFAGETLTNTATAAVLEHQEDDPSNNSATASIVALPEVTDPEDHVFATLGNLQLQGGSFAFPAPGPAPPFPSAAPEIIAVKTHSLTKNTPSLTVASTGPKTTAKSGKVILNADGTFLYTPPVGLKDEQDSFTYTTDNGLTATGQSDSPFPALASAAAASGPGDAIFVFYGDGTSNNQNAGIVLQPGQILVGEGVPIDLTEEGLGLVHPAGSFPRAHEHSWSCRRDGRWLGGPGRTYRQRQRSKPLGRERRRQLR